jgi:hypothetical protein
MNESVPWEKRMTTFAMPDIGAVQSTVEKNGSTDHAER